MNAALAALMPLWCRLGAASVPPWCELSTANICSCLGVDLALSLLAAAFGVHFCTASI